MQSYGGPLPKSWIDKHIVLGKQIIDRELELGMSTHSTRIFRLCSA
ncbi:MAG: alpha-N-acetylglucosaminidase TIM-barrel domain-containing protein [Parabacteroides merdae]